MDETSSTAYSLNNCLFTASGENEANSDSHGRRKTLRSGKNCLEGLKETSEQVCWSVLCRATAQPRVSTGLGY